MYQTRQHETELLYTCFASAAAMYRMTCYLGPYIFDPRGGPGLENKHMLHSRMVFYTFKCYCIPVGVHVKGLSSAKPTGLGILSS